MIEEPSTRTRVGYVCCRWSTFYILHLLSSDTVQQSHALELRPIRYMVVVAFAGRVSFRQFSSLQVQVMSYFQLVRVLYDFLVPLCCF